MSLFFTPDPLTKAELKQIADAISDAERNTSGEIRVSIRKRRALNERKLSLHELAVHNFFQLGMDKTKEKTGVLIFLSLSDRAFQIIADEGIHKRVSDGHWDRLAAGMTTHFKEKRFCQGICETVRQIGATLSREFPKKSGDTNELPNDVSIG